MLMRRHHHPESPDYYSSLAAASAGVTSPSLSLGIISSSLEVCSFFSIWLFVVLSLYFFTFLFIVSPTVCVWGLRKNQKYFSVHPLCVCLILSKQNLVSLDKESFLTMSNTHTTHTDFPCLTIFYCPITPALRDVFLLIGRQPHSPGCDLTNSRCRAKIISRWGTCWKKPK